MNQEVFKVIKAKWDEFTKDLEGFFVRYVDGNEFNCFIENLEMIYPKDAFIHHNDWTVSWYIDLTEEEIAFVHENAQLLVEFYSK